MKRYNGDLLSMLESFFVEYLPNTKGLSANSIRSYQFAFRLLFQFLYDEKGMSPEKVTFETLSRETIEDFLSYLEQQRGCSVKTRNLRRAALVSFSNYAFKQNFSTALPLQNSISKIPKKKEPKVLGIKCFTKEEVAIILSLPNPTTITGQRDVTLLSILYASGARAQELCDITLGDVSIGSPTKIRLTGKGRKTRIVTIPDSCTRILRGYLSARGFDPQDRTISERHLFSSQMQEHMTIACVEGIVKKYVAKAKQLYPNLYKEDTYTPHTFRHSIATHMLESGDSLVAIKAFLGHASISTTCIYAAVSPELANRYLDARGNPLEKAAEQKNCLPLPQALPFLF